MVDAIGTDLTNYVMVVIFFVIALLGAYGHYIKDRYFEKKIDCGLWFYITNDKRSTYNTLKTIVATVIPLAIAHSGGYIPSLAELYGALLAGYGSDSVMNHAYGRDEEK